MEADKNKKIKIKIKNNQDRLAFNAPLISTRRSCSSYGAINGADRARLPSIDATRQTVPFSWEISPGVPKDQIPKDVYVDSMHFPPKPPPGRWRRQPSYSREGSDGDDDGGSSGDDVFSDALDEIALCEELDFASRLSSLEAAPPDDEDRRRRRAVRRAPSFIMKRFLPAANALAKASAAAHSTNPNPNPKRSNIVDPPASSSHDRVVQQKQQRSKHGSRRGSSAMIQESSINLNLPRRVQDQTQIDKMTSGACGLMLFVPWTLKPIACGFKSPVNALSRRSAAIDEPCVDDHRWSFDDGGGLRADHKMMSSKNWHSPGGGTSNFLDTTRLRISKGRDQVERWKAKARMKEFGGGSEMIMRGDDHKKRRSGVMMEYDEYSTHRNEREIWKGPHLTSPSESWLSHALRSTTRRDY